MKITTYRQRINKRIGREMAQYTRLMSESKAGNRRATKILNRINEIDKLLQMISRSKENGKHDLSLTRFQIMINKELSKVLKTEKKMLLKLGTQGGTPRTYLKMLKRT